MPRATGIEIRPGHPPLHDLEANKVFATSVIRRRELAEIHIAALFLRDQARQVRAENARIRAIARENPNRAARHRTGD